MRGRVSAVTTNTTRCQTCRVERIVAPAETTRDVAVAQRARCETREREFRGVPSHADRWERASRRAGRRCVMARARCFPHMHARCASLITRPATGLGHGRTGDAL